VAGRPDSLLSPRLQRLAQRPVSEVTRQEERCELCGNPIPAAHRHLLDLAKHELLCSCRACSTLFDRGASAGGGHFRLVPDRRLVLVDFELPDLTWERLRIPVDMAFFFHSSEHGRVMAFYPSPMGPTESLLALDAWQELEARNPVLAAMEHDVEALLVNRARGARRHWLVGVDECYALVGLIRTRWKGLSGGQEAWEEIDRFFEDLDGRSRPASRDGSRLEATRGAAPAGRGG
jgi:hypothetical protein